MENKSGDVDVPNSNTCRAIVLFQPNNADCKKKSSVHHSRVQVQCPNLMEENSTAQENPNLMEQNSTIHESPNLMAHNSIAHSYERGDSKDNLSTRVQLRRRKRKWSSLEEETLRTGVKPYVWRRILGQPFHLRGVLL
ncbi:hypothetical protein AHAS_Ahas13G0464700 [Arachis hypogaea]